MTELLFLHKDEGREIFLLLRPPGRRRKKTHAPGGWDAMEMRRTATGTTASRPK
jgi:hypothetical protein